MDFTTPNFWNENSQTDFTTPNYWSEYTETDFTTPNSWTEFTETDFTTFTTISPFDSLLNSTESFETLIETSNFTDVQKVLFATKVYLKNKGTQNICAAEDKQKLIMLLFNGVLLVPTAIFGIIGNIISALVLMQKSSNSSFSVILITLAMSDTMYLILRLYVTTPYRFLQYFEIGLSLQAFICYTRELVRPLVTAAYTTSSYLTVLISIGRLIAIKWPLHSRAFMSKRRTKILAVGIPTVVLLLCIPSLFWRWSRKTLFNYDLRTCLSDKSGYDPFRHTFNLIFHYAIPIVSIAITNCFIIAEVRKLSKSQKTLNPAQAKNLKLTKMLMTVVGFSFLCNITGVLQNLSFHIFHYVCLETAALSNYMNSLNASVNFVIYCAYGKSFRHSFMKTLCCSESKRLGRAGTTSTTCTSIKQH